MKVIKGIDYIRRFFNCATRWLSTCCFYQGGKTKPIRVYNCNSFC